MLEIYQESSVVHYSNEFLDCQKIIQLTEENQGFTVKLSSYIDKIWGILCRTFTLNVKLVKAPEQQSGYRLRV